MLLLLVACGHDGVVEDPVYSGNWDVPVRSDLYSLDLPTNEDGDYVLVSQGDAQLVANPDDRDAISAAAECGAVVLACLAPDRNLLGCLQNVPTCDSDTPWTGDGFCCDASCEDAYVELRLDGAVEADALSGAVFGPNSCMPGVDEALNP
jgi:hypothetical protein